MTPSTTTPILSGKKVAILATDGFEEIELLDPKSCLEQAGATTYILSPKGGEIQGYNNDVEPARKQRVDMLLDQAKPDQFDAVFLPGGCVGADTLRIVPSAQKFIREIDQRGIPIAVICHGPWLLISAGLLRGRTLTGYPTIQDDIRNAGGTWLDQEVVRDRNWVSSRDPNDLPAFDRSMLELFSGRTGK